MNERQPIPMDGADASGSIDQTQIFSALARRKYFILGSTALAFLAALAFVTLVKPRYTADAKVLVENQENYFTRPEKVAGASDQGLSPDSEAVQSQVQIVQSRDLARRAIKELGLVNNKEFDPQAEGGGSIGRVLVMLGLARNPASVSAEDRVLDAYFEKLTVLSPPKTRIVSVEFSSNDPDLAARGANKIADLYIETQSAAKRETARQIAASLDSQIAELRIRLAEAETRSEAFRVKSGLLVGANNLSITAQQLGDINAQLSVARSQQADAQAKARLIRDMVRQGRIGDVPDIANNDLMRRISEQRVTLKSQLALESRALLPGHPRIKELSAQIAELDGEIRIAADKAARALENDGKIAGSRVENLQATLETQKRAAGVANADDVTLRAYESQARLLKEQLEGSTAKYQEALARQAALSTPADARIVSRAVAPSQPSFPKKVPILVAATVAGLVFSLGGVVAAEILTGRAVPGSAPFPAPLPVPSGRANMPIFARLRRRHAAPAADVDVEPKPDAPEFPPAPAPALAPALDQPAGLPVMADIDSELAEKIAAAGPSGTAIVSLMAGIARDQAELLAVKAVALARALSRDSRAILVNLDRDGVAIDQMAGAVSAPGLSDLLQGGHSFAEVIHLDALTRLHVLPFGGGRAVEGDGGLDMALDALCETYDHVILAAPAIATSDLASALAPYADFAVLRAPAGADGLAARAAYDEMRKAGAGEVLLLIDAPTAPRSAVSAA